MRAVVYDEFRLPPRTDEVPEPTPASDAVVVEVAATGLCRSDWHGWMGHDPDIRPPHVPGHEFAGTVVAVGRDVTTARVGDRVTAPFIHACGRCPACLAGDRQVCHHQSQPGFTRWGSFAEYVVVDRAEVNLVHLPDGVGTEGAAALGCRFATAFRAVTAQGRVRAGEWVAVHGCGGVGLSAVMIARACGAAAGSPALPMDLVLAGELELLGCHGMAAHAYPQLLALVTAGVLDPGRLVTGVIGLGDAPGALIAMDRPASPGIRLIRPR